MLPKTMIQVLSTWLTHRSAASCVLQALIKIVRSSVSDAVHLGTVLEASLIAWFKNSGEYAYARTLGEIAFSFFKKYSLFTAGTAECDWNKVLDMLHESSSPHCPMEDTLVTNNHVLSLYALSVKQLENDENVFLYSKIIQCITSLKPT
jgi:hypothetical protein